MTTRSKSKRQPSRRPPRPRAFVHVQAQDLKTSTPIIAQLGGDLSRLILRWGSVAAAMTAIVISISYALPSFFRLYTSDPAPFEGKLEHSTDLVAKLEPITKSIQNAADAAQKAAQAADHSTVMAQTAAVKEDQRDLCGLMERLANINMRLRDTPGDQFFLDAKVEREREIAVLRSRIQMNGQLLECP